MDIFDAALLAVDPTGSTYITKKVLDKGAEETAANATADASGVTGRQAEDPVSKVCCNEYQIQDGFLLNTNTGAVWKYDQESNSFKVVPKEETDLQKAANGLISLLLSEELHTTKARAFQGVHHTEKQKFEDQFKTMIKLLEPTE